MSDLLLLASPKEKKPYYKGKKGVFSLLGFSCLATIVLSVLFSAHHQELLANLTFNDFQLQSSFKLRAVQEAQEFLEKKNEALVEISVSHPKDDKPLIVQAPIDELGFQYTLNDVFFERNSLENATPFFQDNALKNAAQAAQVETSVQLMVDHQGWDRFAKNLQKMVNQEAQKDHITWVENEGWIYIPAQEGRSLSSEQIDKLYTRISRSLANGKVPRNLSLTVNINGSNSSPEELSSLYAQLEQVVSSPITLQLHDEQYFLNLNEKAYLSVEDGEILVHKEKIQEWVESVAQDFYRPTETIRITGKEEVRPGAFKAITEGEFTEGRRLNVEEVLSQILENIAQRRIANSEALEKLALVTPRSYEIPLKVYSELEEMEYELLSVGYSEYSKGNDPNRVHNIETGLNRINGALIEPGGKISFNKMNGRIDGEFKIGYAISGTEAIKSLGGGICQVSTTFYRALLNAGLPITMRQNHSWDLTYYREGGYGLDATIYPSVGLDVKAVNDLSSHLFFYTYTRPETEEAFVLVYGKGDGRKVDLQPHEEYIPFYGAKTLKWTYKVEMPNGEIREEDIISRYRM